MYAPANSQPPVYSAWLSAYGMYLEGIVRLPRDPADTERFTAEVQAAQRAGAAVLRTVMMSGRRYEAFETSAAFRRSADAACFAERARAGRDSSVLMRVAFGSWVFALRVGGREAGKK